jgi:hypothetical protein
MTLMMRCGRGVLILPFGLFAFVVATGSPPEVLPRDEEVALAESAAPAHLRAKATVYALEKNGFVLARKGSNGFTCIVNRDSPLGRKPTCYDAEGAATILPKVLRVGELLMQGASLDAIDREIEEGFRTGKYVAPRRPGIAYMLSKGNRDFNPATGKVRPFPPHVMFYAPNLTNDDVGSSGDGAGGLPFIAYQGPHGFLIMMVPDEARSAQRGGR